MALRLPLSQHKGAMQDREGGNYPAAPASIPAHPSIIQLRLYSDIVIIPARPQIITARVPCSIGRVEIIPPRLRVSQHNCAMQDREGGNHPAVPASIPAQVCHGGSGGWKLSRLACQYPSTSAPCSIGRVEIIPLRLPVSQHTRALSSCACLNPSRPQHKGAMQDREGGNYPAVHGSILTKVWHAASGGWHAAWHPER
jgi:hypothetical protein